MLSGLPYVGVLIMNFSGKLYDLINRRKFVSTNILRKIFTGIGLLGPALLLCFMIYPDNVGKILLLTAAVMLNQLSTTGGYFISHSDVAGPFAGILFGACNTLAMIAGFGNPLVIAGLAPNVRKTEEASFNHLKSHFLISVDIQKTPEEWQNVFYVAAAIAGSGAIVYIIFGQNSLQKWAVVNDEDNETSSSTATTIEDDTEQKDSSS